VITTVILFIVSHFTNFTSFASLIKETRFYHDIDSEDSGGEDDEEIHNPNLPYITKREMRYYIFNFGNELFKNGLIQRLNKDNKQWKSSEQYAAANKKWIELDLINNLLRISLSDREY
jgi:hypothetical protein